MAKSKKPLLIGGGVVLLIGLVIFGYFATVGMKYSEGSRAVRAVMDHGERVKLLYREQYRQQSLSALKKSASNPGGSQT